MKKKPDKFSMKKKIGAVAVATVLAAGTYFAISFNQGKPFFVPAYQVLRVIDGDTFETTDNQRIRVASAQAPELNRCGWEEAKTALEELILGKPLYIKVHFRDKFQRLVSLVYADNVFINTAMLQGGYSYFYGGSPGSGVTEQLSIATETARGEKKGIFSETCTQMINKEEPSCNIKGNTRNGNIYYVPKCGVYDNVEVQLYLGDRWFCSEKEAVKAGFRKPEQCP